MKIQKEFFRLYTLKIKVSLNLSPAKMFGFGPLSLENSHVAITVAEIKSSKVHPRRWKHFHYKILSVTLPCIYYWRVDRSHSIWVYIRAGRCWNFKTNNILFHGALFNWEMLNLVSLNIYHENIIRII